MYGKMDHKFLHEETCFRKTLNKEKMKTDYEIADMTIKMKEMRGLLREWAKLGTYVSVMHPSIPVKDLLLRTCTAIPQAKRVSQQTFVEMKKKEKGISSQGGSSSAMKQSSPPQSRSSSRSSSRGPLRTASPSPAVVAQRYENRFEEAIQTAKLDVERIFRGSNDNPNVGDVEGNGSDGIDNSNEEFFGDSDKTLVKRWRHDDDDVDDDINVGGIMFWELPDVTSTPTHPKDRNDRLISWRHDFDSDGMNGNRNGDSIDEKIEDVGNRNQNKGNTKRNDGNDNNDNINNKTRNDDHDWFTFLERSARKERKRFVKLHTST